MRITIPDDLYDRIVHAHGKRAEAAILRALDIVPLQEKGRTLTLDGPQLARLEALLAGGSVQSGGDLIRKVEALAHFEVGKVVVDFDATDWARLGQRATRLGLTIPAYLTLMLDRFKEDWMTIGEPVVLDPVQEPAGAAK